MANQVKLVLNNKSTACTSTGTKDGSLYFDPVSHSIWVDGMQWYMQNDNYKGAGYDLKFGVNDGTSIIDVSTFDQSAEMSINFVSSGHATITKGTNKITFGHDSSQHIPSGNTTANRLLIGDGTTPKNASWDSSTFNTSATQPMYVSAGVIKPTDYVLEQNVTSTSKLTDTTYKFDVRNAAYTVGTSSNKISDPYLSLYNGGTDSSLVQFIGGSNVLVTSGSDTDITIESDGTWMSRTSYNQAVAFRQWFDASVGADYSKVDSDNSAINTWHEIEKFFDSNFKDSSTLGNYLALYDNTSHVDSSVAHANVTTSVNGFVPYITENSGAATSTVKFLVATPNAQGNYTSATWKTIPSQNLTDPAAYTEAGVTYNGTAKKTITYTSAVSATTSVTATGGVVTFKGPQLITSVPSTDAISQTNAGKTDNAYCSNIEYETYFWQTV